MYRSIKAIFLFTLICALLVLGQLLWWVLAPLPISSPTLEISIEPGTTVRQIAKNIEEAGVDIPNFGLYAIFRISGEDKQIRAGNYEFTAEDSGWSLLKKLIRGEENSRTITLIEGWNMRQFRAQMAKSEGLKHETEKLSDEQIMQMLGQTNMPAEGHFYPDTYTYSKGTSDTKIYKRAFDAMQKHINNAWQDRSAQAQVKTPEEALILASIVEKETGLASDRPMISSVFNNRLRLGMLLQTDPTVIYGLGAQFDGNLRRNDLKADHPWNTYVHPGLPPTPIAMPGKAAILATLKPAQSDALYFVAKGDGSSEFSSTLEAHNQAVQKYQLNRVKDYKSQPGKNLE